MRSLLLLLLLCAAAFGQRLSPLAPPPQWSELERYHGTITQAELQQALETVYAPGGAWRGTLSFQPEGLKITTRLSPPAYFTLRLATTLAPAPAQPWRAARTLPPAPAEQPLAGVKIALDPGHLGGAWARMEERYFRIGESQPVQEGDLTLQVAQHLAPLLCTLGAEVTLVRTALEPLTSARPESLRTEARTQIQQHAAPGNDINREAELLFYRISEIRERAKVVNEQIKPDLTVCLHFNAEAWGDPQHPEFVPRNHLHTLINGCYSAAELRNDDLRLEMLLRLLSHYLPEEQAASEAIAASLVKAAGLAPYTYTTNVAVPVGTSGFVWARNLLANRLYRSPVVFLEPYVMNSELVWSRVQAGDYEGEVLIGGQKRKSLVREYADAVAEGLANYYRQARPK